MRQIVWVAGGQQVGNGVGLPGQDQIVAALANRKDDRRAGCRTAGGGADDGCGETGGAQDGEGLAEQGDRLRGHGGRGDNDTARDVRCPGDRQQAVRWAGDSKR